LYIFLIPHFFRHQTMDKFQKYNSFNTWKQQLHGAIVPSFDAK